MNTALNNFNWPLVRLLADYSDKAYRNETATDRATDAQALVTMMHDGVVVAFRGSSSPADFLQDGKIDKQPAIFSRHDFAQPFTAKVHRGFLEDYSALSVAVVSQVKTCLDACKRVMAYPKIYVTGHSLGGALAILCAYDLAQQGLPVGSVITFGQPRVGNESFRDLYNSVSIIANDGDHYTLGDITFHVINANDPVPLMPPLLFGYRDEGNEIFLPHHSGFALNPPIGLEIVSDVLGVFSAWRHHKLAFIPNHLMDAYLERIQAP